MSSPVLISFASTHKATQQELEWNLMASPLVCISLSIMDNMIADNIAIMEAFNKQHIEDTIRSYSEASDF